MCASGTAGRPVSSLLYKQNQVITCVIGFPHRIRALTVYLLLSVMRQTLSAYLTSRQIHRMMQCESPFTAWYFSIQSRHADVIFIQCYRQIISHNVVIRTKPSSSFEVQVFQQFNTEKYTGKQIQNRKWPPACTIG